MKSKHNSGFPLLEVMVVTTIIGIIAAASTYSIGNFIKEKRSEQHVMALWSELGSLRSRAIKDNCPYIVRLTVGTGNILTYTVYKNDAGDYNLSTSTVETKGLGQASGLITAGKATQGTTVNGTGLPGGLPSENFTGEWKTFTPNGTAITNAIIFRADAIGSISSGTLLIQNSAVKSCGYALTKSGSGHTLKLYKWDGSKWYEM